MPEVELTGRAAPLYRLLDWPMRLALVTLLWLLGVAAGLVIAGIAPATLASHQVLISGEAEVRLWSRFWSAWRAWFVRGQVVLGPPLATVWVLAFYLAASRQTLWAWPLSVVTLGYLVSLWLLPAVAVTASQLRAKDLWLLTLHLTWRRPALPLAGTAGLIALALAGWYVVPAALMFWPAGSALAAVLVVRRVSRPPRTRGIQDPTRSDPPAR
ncbi:putative membrane protein YesL [Kribbella sp. VKM Ac-2569]|uniref:DUF624 domain-containing protein n=1 Tax=Kribbella sp. VKM Ac-2569 TaxID=2512220 RepID=UPI0010E54610|nr:DUF624 domain-containing protein [Kribbella sp. VKM Ac-2569]RZT07571.1 putative membrane protein YesL [Kribbella sp. VKM Ac-2569]